MNCESILFERSLFPFLQDCLRNWFLCQLSSHAGPQILYDSAYSPVEYGHPSDHFFTVDLEPPNPTISIHIARVSNMAFIRMMWVVFSLICWMRVTQCMASGGTHLNPLTSWSPFDILPILAQDLPSDGISDFYTVLCFSSWPSVWGLYFTKGDSLWYAISTNRVS